MKVNWISKIIHIWVFCVSCFACLRPVSYVSIYLTFKDFDIIIYSLIFCRKILNFLKITITKVPTIRWRNNRYTNKNIGENNERKLKKGTESANTSYKGILLGYSDTYM